MKRIQLLIAGIATTATIFTMTGGVARAESSAFNSEKLTLSQIIKTPYFEQFAEKPKEPFKEEVKIEVKEPEPPKPIEYTVVSGDNLTKIAEVHQTTWQRIYQKNTSLVDPNRIDVGDKLVIPLPNEVLAERQLPIYVAPPQQATTSYTASGNTYGYGYCTWYVKNRRPDLPNNLGNANTWYYMAQNDGLATGTTPRAGAVDTTTRGSLGHVVYVESVNSDGTINISEMNYRGWNVTSSRTASASEFLYIY